MSLAMDTVCDYCDARLDDPCVGPCAEAPADRAGAHYWRRVHATRVPAGAVDTARELYAGPAADPRPVAPTKPAQHVDTPSEERCRSELRDGSPGPVRLANRSKARDGL